MIIDPVRRDLQRFGKLGLKLRYIDEAPVHVRRITRAHGRRAPTEAHCGD